MRRSTVLTAALLGLVATACGNRPEEPYSTESGAGAPGATTAPPGAMESQAGEPSALDPARGAPLRDTFGVGRDASGRVPGTVSAADTAARRDTLR